MKELPYRQIHLDFHTSPYIPDAGRDFDPEAFVDTLKMAYVESVNVFAKCHHGLSYYPTKVGRMHPALKIDLLGEMLRVLHRDGIKAPIYFPVGWEEVSADNANWLEVGMDGVLGTISPFEANNYKWRKLCLNKDGYLDFVLRQTQEIIDLYEVDGFWYDIIFQKKCVCSDCITEMKSMGLNPQLEADVLKHDFHVLKKFNERVSRYVRERLPETLIFFNGSWGPDGGYDQEYTLSERSRHMTHVEIESLPSELWGYNHFPLFVNYHNRHNAEVVGMNGKFHTAWGDFGSLRNLEALEYECFRMIMNGSKCCIGDQLHPRGKLDGAVYARVGQVFEQIEAREPWCKGSAKQRDIGVLLANRPLETDYAADEGVMRMLLELHLTFDFIDCMDDFSGYRLLILPDRVLCDRALAAKLDRYVQEGGKVLATCHSGLDEAKQEFLFTQAGVTYEGENPYCPAYLLRSEALGGGPDDLEYVMYEQGAIVSAREGTQTLAELGKPYFNRTWDRFCSHRHFPYDGPTGAPAITDTGSVIYIANPLFTDYINMGVRIYRDVVAACIERLLPDPLVRTDLLASAELSLRSQENRQIVHLLHYIAERKSRKLDIVDTRLPLHDFHVEVKTDRMPGTITLEPEGLILEGEMVDGGYVRVHVPEMTGHAMLVLQD